MTRVFSTGLEVTKQVSGVRKVAMWLSEVSEVALRVRRGLEVFILFSRRLNYRILLFNFSQNTKICVTRICGKVAALGMEQ